MNNSQNRLMTSVVLVAMFGIIALAGSRATHSAAQGSANVVVTNTTSQAVPVAIQGLPLVKAAITNAPQVRPISSAAAPIFTEDDSNGRNEVRIYNTGFMADGSITSTGTLSYSPASGKRLVVDYVAVSSQAVTAGNYASSCEFMVMNGGSQVGSVWIPMNPPTAGGLYSMGSAPAHFVVDAGETLQSSVHRDVVNDSGIAPLELQVSGHLINYP